jgi:hypothetical protein
VKISDKLYVGFQRERYSKSDTPRILGFAVPYGNTKAEQSRIETVDNWSDRSETARIIENKPIRGFKLTDVVSRCSTSNKLFRVADPRGFELEISASNMLDLISSSTIVKGEIIEECIWGVESKVYLINTSSDYYRGLENTKANSVSLHEEGKYYVSGENLVSVFRFDGIRYHTYLDVNHYVVKGHRVEVAMYVPAFVIDEYDTVIEINMDKNPSYIYTEFIVGIDGALSEKYIHTRKSYYKNMCEYQGGFVADSLNSASISLDTPDDSRSADAFFKSKKDAMSYDYSGRCKDVRPHVYARGTVDMEGGFYGLHKMLAEDAIQNIKIVDKRQGCSK